MINELNKRKQPENLLAGARKFPLLRALALLNIRIYMNYLRILPLLTSAFLVSACSTNHTQYSLPENQLYGTWNCQMDFQEEDVKLSFDYDITYVRNGKSNGFGSFKFKAPDIPEMEYSIADSSNWELNNGYLIETTTEIKLVNISHPEFDDLLNLESMFPQNLSESSEILVLNDSLLKTKSESDGTIISCNKVVNES